MARYELSLEQTYQQDWKLWEAFREFVSNAYDAEVRYRERGIGAMECSYSQADQRITITSKDVEVPNSALLMGMSESRNHGGTIGTFGEGLPMALLAMARLPQYKVTIYNGLHKWSPAIEWSEQFGSNVLCINTRKQRTSRNGFVVVIDGIPSQTWRDLRRRVLWLDPPPDRMVFKAMNGEMILLDNKYRGMVFNRGVFVTERSDVPFGFSLELALNRDRHIPDEWDLRWGVGRLVGEAVRSRPDLFAEDIAEAIFGESSLLNYSADQYQGTALIEAMVDHFRGRYGEDAEPVASEAEVNELEHFGRRCIVVNATANKLLARHFGTVAERKHRLKSAISKVYKLAALETEEFENFKRVTALLSGHVDATLLGNLEVVDFEGDLLGYYSSGIPRVSRKVLKDFRELLITAVHEIAHDTGATDGTLSHSERQVALLAAIVADLAGGK